MKNILTYADGLAVCADGISMPTVFWLCQSPPRPMATIGTAHADGRRSSAS
jgi:hypothetical protein